MSDYCYSTLTLYGNLSFSARTQAIIVTVKLLVYPTLLMSFHALSIVDSFLLPIWLGLHIFLAGFHLAVAISLDRSLPFHLDLVGLVSGQRGQEQGPSAAPMVTATRIVTPFHR